MPSPLAVDALEIAGNGGIPLERVRERNRVTDESPEQFLHGGMHHDDTTDAYRRQFMRRGQVSSQLPREKLLRKVVAGAYKRPTPRNWQK